MGTEETAPGLVPKTFRFTDIDAFRSSVRSLEVDFTPLTRTISAEQTVLNLASCDVNFTRSFPRIIDARLAPDCTTVGFTMDDDGAPIRFNGVERDHAVVVIGSDGAAFSSVERTERRYAGIVFRPTVRDRGWPETTVNFRIFETSFAAQQRLRELVVRVLSVAPLLADGIGAKAASAAIRESLLAGVDAVFAEGVPARWTMHANSPRMYKIFKDIEEALSSNLGNPIYSEQLAREVRVSVRALHDAVLRYRGMSLHRYLRLRRLWLVRKQLLAGTPSVKACALAFGFWHLGDFSASYRLQFGETPSQTLARSGTA
jgi:AraC family ethanolamine operon transcriptional activator